MQDRIAQETEGRRQLLRITGASAACVVALAVACSSPIADQTAAPKASDATPSSAKAPARPQVVNPDQPYFEFQVEQPVGLLAGSPQPKYPAALKEANVEGEVLAQYVVNADGRVDLSTFKVLKATRQEFVDAVRAVLPDMRFSAAEVGGHKVKQLVQQPFTFAVSTPYMAGPIVIPNPKRFK